MIGLTRVIIGKIGEMPETYAEEEEGKDAESNPLDIAFRLIGEERMITGPEPGLTRDSISVEWRFKDQRFKITNLTFLFTDLR